MAQWSANQTSIHGWVQSLPSLSCHELWYRSQTQLRSCVAVAVVQASDYSSNWTPSLGTYMCRGCGHKKTKRQKKKNESTDDKG